MRNHRRTLGSRFYEGTRLLWGVLETRELTISAAAELLGWSRGTLSNVLYGERLPGVGMLAKILEVFGVPLEAWAQAPTQPFIPPAAREAAEPARGAA